MPLRPATCFLVGAPDCPLRTLVVCMLRVARDQAGALASGSGLRRDTESTQPGLSTEEGWRGAARGDDLEASVVREEAEPAPWNPACVRPALARGPATRACRSAVSEHRRCTGGSQRSAWRVSLSNTRQSFARKLSIGSLLVA